jgi:hypothetical protein
VGRSHLGRHRVGAAGRACHLSLHLTGTIGGSDRDQGGLTKGRLAAFVAALAGSAVLGIVAGLVWAAVAPRALLQEVAHGAAQVVNAETSAFIVADAWFCLIAALGGVITGVVGDRVLVRRAGWVAAAGLVLGAVAAALLAMWVGENVGLGSYNHLLASSAVGTFFHASLALGAKSALAFWPLLTSAVILLAETGTRRAARVARSPVHEGQDPTEAGGVSVD